MLQSLAVPSQEAVNTEMPSAENVADITSSSWPAKVWMQAPLSMLQSSAVLSSDAVNTVAISRTCCCRHAISMACKGLDARPALAAPEFSSLVERISQHGGVISRNVAEDRPSPWP